LIRKSPSTCPSFYRWSDISRDTTALFTSIAYVFATIGIAERLRKWQGKELRHCAAQARIQRGIDHPKVVILDDYLTRKSVDIGMNVAVVGGDNGAEVAYSLAREGKRITLIEKSRQVAQAPYLIARWPLLLDYAREAGVKILTETALKSIKNDGVVVADKEGKEELIKVDTVLLALERVPNNELPEKLKGKVPELYQVGDCVVPKHLQNAIHSAYHTAREI